MNSILPTQHISCVDTMNNNIAHTPVLNPISIPKAMHREWEFMQCTHCKERVNKVFANHECEVFVKAGKERITKMFFHKVHVQCPNPSIHPESSCIRLLSNGSWQCCHCKEIGSKDTIRVEHPRKKRPCQFRTKTLPVYSSHHKCEHGEKNGNHLLHDHGIEQQQQPVEKTHRCVTILKPKINTVATMKRTFPNSLALTNFARPQQIIRHT